MRSTRHRIAAVVIAAAASALVLGQAPALADDHHGHGHGMGPLPVAIVSPAPGKITKERKITDTYSYDAKGGSSEEQPPPGGSTPPAPSAPEPGPATAAKDTLNSTAQSAVAGASSTVDSTLK
ncbi:hypothetical protein [Streptomyces syringium]|uniref:hypothetical protein n=1 Tax=Streptomyces syringium TaxID=76729 RepID=UPI0033BA54A8